MNSLLQKSSLTINGDELILGVPFMKIDAERRVVGGFATLDNEDKVGEVLTKEASLEAFGEWPGNIREMHQKKAVGKALKVIPQRYTDDETGEVYDGIWVEAKISKGAQDTWEKVMDGTLTGFSVGGAILQKEFRLSKISGATKPHVTKYRLSELSVVDTPCNGLASFNLIKSLETTDILDMEDIEKSVSTEVRAKAQDDGDTLEDGSFPITNQHQMNSAARLIGMTHHSKDDIVTHMRKQASKYGLTLPPMASEGVEKMDQVEELAKAKQAAAQMAPGPDCDGSDDSHGGAAHIDLAAQHLSAAAAHAATAGDHHSAADAHRQAANLSDMAKDSRYRAAIAAASPMSKSVEEDNGKEEKLHNNNNSDKSILGDLTSEDLLKFVEFAKNLDKPEAANTADELNEGDDTDMNEETLTKALTEMTDNISKMLSDKVDGVGTDLEEIKKRFDAVATSESLEELKKELGEVTGRVSALESSGAIQKSTEAAGGEKLEKRAESLWADSIVPSILKDRFSGK